MKPQTELQKLRAKLGQIELQKIRAKLGHLTLDWKPSKWMNTGFPDLNEVLGDRDLGAPYGRIMEISGPESHGKTALVLSLAARAQSDGAFVLWADFENSFDEKWAQLRGLDTDNLILIQPYVGRFGKKKKEERLSTAQELCTEVEQVLTAMHKNYPKMFLAVDSITSMLPEGEAAAGLEGINMRSKMELPMFLGILLRRWVGLAQSYSTFMVFINQLRQSPIAFGNPWYTPGGNAMRFYSHIRVRVRRVKGGRMMHNNKQIGIKGILTNFKNKSGGLEGSKVGYRLLFSGPIEFLSAEKLIKEESE